jgi:hypothetical protein
MSVLIARIHTILNSRLIAPESFHPPVHSLGPISLMHTIQIYLILHLATDSCSHDIPVPVSTSLKHPHLRFLLATYPTQSVHPTRE